MLILFPSEPMSPKSVDADFKEEHQAAEKAGFETALYSHEALEKGNHSEALRQLSMRSSSQRTLLRGWMLPGELYASFYENLGQRNYQLETNPKAYEEAHYLPLAWPHIQGHTARSAWTRSDSPDEAWQLYQSFKSKPAIIKDWVKSAKSRWHEACYIPANTAEQGFHEITKNFRNERGRLFNRGTVLREFLPLRRTGEDLRGQPIVDETRLFFWQHQLLVRPRPRSPGPLDQEKLWLQVVSRFASPFLSMDIAQLEDGTWRIIEVGDGGVSGLPSGLDPQDFYENLKKAIGGPSND